MAHAEHKRSSLSFATSPVKQVVLRNSIPALIAMVMVMVYNLADTFFIGLTHDDFQLAAVSFASPVFMIFMSLGTLFGVGGTSVISRAFGAGKAERAKQVSSFCMWACVAVGLFFMLLVFIFRDKLIVLFGAGAQTMDYTRSYLTITLFCGVFSMISNCFSNVIRTEGQPMKAMTGTLLGNLINIVLDPILILALGWGVTGAAVATVIGNVVSALYYLLYFAKGTSALSISPKHFSVRDGILREVLSVGISASLANLLVSLSSIVVNIALTKYEGGELCVAAYGVSSKVLMIVTLFGIGIGSGVQPFFGYCYGAGNRARLREGIRVATAFGLLVCLSAAALCFIFAGPIVRVMLSQEAAWQAAIRFTRIMMSTAWLIGAFAVFQNGLQAMGAALPALLSSVFRQGIILIPALFILQAAFGLNGLIWAQPVADVLSLAIVACMLTRKLKDMDRLTGQ